MDIAYLRSFRVSGVALFDYIASYLAIFILITITGVEHKPLYYALITPLAVVAHTAVGQKTTFTENLFNNELNSFKVSFGIIISYLIYLLREEFL